MLLFFSVSNVYRVIFKILLRSSKTDLAISASSLSISKKEKEETEDLFTERVLSVIFIKTEVNKQESSVVIFSVVAFEAISIIKNRQYFTNDFAMLSQYCPK